jgi:hypothetical protein
MGTSISEVLVASIFRLEEVLSGRKHKGRED